MDKFVVVVFIPCKNEEGYIGRTIVSLKTQTRPPDVIIVGDHQSTDRTAEIARSLGATVVFCTSKIKRKGANLDNIYKSVTFRNIVSNPPPDRVIVVIIDADTIIDPQGIEKMIGVFNDQKVMMACGYVLPSEVKNIWQAGRLVEYNLSLNWHKRIQAGWNTVLVCSGCFTAIRLKALNEIGGFPVDGLSEDMAMTWRQILISPESVRFVPDALCYTQEPPNLLTLIRQLSRWSTGFFENLYKYRKEIFSFRQKAFSIFVLFWVFEGLITPILPLITLLGYLYSHGDPRFIQTYLLFAGISETFLTVAPAMVGGIKTRRLLLTMVSFPCYYLLRLLATFVWFKSLLWEWLRKKPQPEWAKGH